MLLMQTFKTFFKKEIFAEIAMPPLRQGYAGQASTKVVILCNGAPAVPSKKTLMEFLVKKGYTVIHMRYRGSWESKGEFLKKSLEQDLIDVIEELPKGFKDLWSGEKFKIQVKTITVMGSSFGGPAVLLASNDSRVTKAIAFSPVVDWNAPSKEEPMPKFVQFMKEAYGQVYRGNNWNKLGRDGFYEPTGKEDGSKILIIHAKDDEVVHLKEVAEYAQKTKTNSVLLKSGGHMGTSSAMDPKIWKRVSKFLKK